ncbi:hypothetical protein Y032_0689g1553 [Ancylostoma ceylanicum]|uniref:Uncharacterized protein n=1 Tax=Ancylostoma ceylanicum TaxID=53326 RepID=A0A016WIL5_9BILA|nr:hypothetical protein Y032_0689g1553 [Ancylostoma ceylanicum]
MLADFDVGHGNALFLPIHFKILSGYPKHFYFGDTVSPCPTPLLTPIVVEWGDSGHEVAIELTKYPDVLSRYTLVAQGFRDCFCLNCVEGFLQIDERETERHLVLS